MPVLKVTTERARRLFLAAQGLLGDPPALYPLIEQLGFVQVDSINVVERAHHLTLWARLPRYRREELSDLLERRLLFEHWTHDASLVPTLWLPQWSHRFERYERRVRQSSWWQERLGSEETIARVLERIRAEGPLRSRDFEGTKEPGGWWAWKEPKAALEFLWRTGRLAVRHRERFEKVYDLAERVLPAVQPVSRAEHVEWGCRTALERLGLATPAEVAAYWASLELAEAREWCARHARVVSLEGKPFYALEETLAQEPPEPEDRLRLLSPFDPVVRDRKRALRLFGFDYRFEAFVPGPQRVYGYYVLPVLEGERFVARIDLKRGPDRLEVRGVWWEAGVRPRPARLRKALEKLARFLGVGAGAGDH